MVLTVSFVVSPETGLFVSVACEMVHKLDTSVGASGRYDFSVCNWRIRLVHYCIHRFPRPTFVTIAKRPSLCERETAEDIWLIWGCGEAENFCKRGWTATQISDPRPG
jgi:hypothetical protein